MYPEKAERRNTRTNALQGLPCWPERGTKHQWLRGRGMSLQKRLPRGVNVRVGLPLTRGMLGVTVLHLILGTVAWEHCLFRVETLALPLALAMLRPPQRQGVRSPESLQLSALQGSHPWQRTAWHMVTLFWRWPASNGRWWQECKSLAILGHLETTLKGYSSSRAFHAINENLEPQPQLSLSLHPPLHPSPPFHGC